MKTQQVMVASPAENSAGIDGSSDLVYTDMKDASNLKSAVGASSLLMIASMHWFDYNRNNTIDWETKPHFVVLHSKKTLDNNYCSNTTVALVNDHRISSDGFHQSDSCSNWKCYHWHSHRLYYY